MSKIAGIMHFLAFSLRWSVRSLISWVLASTPAPGAHPNTKQKLAVLVDERPVMFAPLAAGSSCSSLGASWGSLPSVVVSYGFSVCVDPLFSSMVLMLRPLCWGSSRFSLFFHMNFSRQHAKTVKKYMFELNLAALRTDSSTLRNLYHSFFSSNSLPRRTCIPL